MKRCHSMPFGAALQKRGVRFRLWAPAAHAVELVLAHDAGEEAQAMSALTGGWFELTVPHAHAHVGTLYRYRLDGQLPVADPASRCNPGDVHGASEVIDPAAYDWQDADWRGRSWEEAVIYELHVGCATPQGTFAALLQRLDYLVALGVTAIELMPLADFPGAFNWGYDGVLPFAPDGSYGRPDDLKLLIDSAHRKGLMVLLDVVYNHFGPEGNYLHQIAPPFFTDRHHTPWGSAINFDGPDSATVRDFFVHNALYCLEEFHFDGLRLDAVHAIFDDSAPDFLTQLAQAVRSGPGRERQIHLVLENDRNVAHYLARDASGGPRRYTAQWDDDLHHCLHLLATGEADGYYADYADDPAAHLGRCLAEGFAYQGQASGFRGGQPRGEVSRDLPLTAFVGFLQNHDQVGNRAYGERLHALADPDALRAVTAILLLAPSPPLLFMGQEFAAAQPFQFFCDFGPDLAAAVTQGRRQEFAHFAEFGAAEQAASIPDPCDAATFLRSKLDWDQISASPHDQWLDLHRALLALRHAVIVPLLPLPPAQARFRTFGARGLIVQWPLQSGGMLTLSANLGAQQLIGFDAPRGELVYASDAAVPAELAMLRMAPWSVAWFLLRDGQEAAP